jgi:chromosome segregation ATPase
VSHLDQDIATIKAQIEKLTSPLAGGGDARQAAEADREELREQWDKLLRARGLLQEELKEDGWLVRFRTYVTLIN